MKDLGLEELRTASCFFVKEELVRMCLVVHLVMFARRESGINEVKRELNNKFRLNDFGKPKRPLGNFLNGHRMAY